MSDIDRRGFIRVSAAGAVAASVGALACDDDGATATPQDAGLDGASQDAASADARTPPDGAPADGPEADAEGQVDGAAGSQVFPTTPLAGAMEPTVALLCGQVVGHPMVDLRVWPLDDPDAPVVDEAVAAPEGYVKIELTDLTPATRYAAQLTAGGESSSVARFRTAPAAGDLSPVTIGATSCTKSVAMPYETLSLAAEDDFDVFCHLGDMSYNDGAETLEEYRGAWQRTLGDPGYRAIFAKAGMYYTWDDHEFVNNLSGRDEIPEPRRTAALESIFEALPIRRFEGDRLWTSFRWGHCVEFFVLDSRMEREPATRETADARYLSEAQFTWLTEGLRDSPCHFKVLLNSVPITDFPEVWPSTVDRWQGYAAQRRALLDFVTAEGVGNVWFLSGDFHFGAVIRVEPPDAPRNFWEVLAGPAATTGNPVVIIRDDPARREEWTPESRFVHFSGGWSATTLTFDPAADSVRVRFVDAETREVLYDEVLRDADL